MDTSFGVPSHSPADLSRTLRRVYASLPAKQRLMAGGRPYIAPLEMVIAAIPYGARLLDMGCGAGFVTTLALAKRGVGFATGVDVDATALEFARQAVTANFGNADVEFQTLDAWNAAPKAGYDAVTLVDVLHHVPWALRDSFLRRLMASLNAGGVFIFKDINEKPAWGAAANYMHDLVMTGERVRLTPVARVEDLARDAGLRLVEAADVMRLWYPHQFRVFRRAA